MKNRCYILCVFALVLSACNSSLYIMYVGDKTVTGQGGFPQDWYSSEHLGLSREYPNSGVGFWASGLPKGQKCQLIGFAQDYDRKNLAKTILKSGGNIATQSDVSFPIRFDKNDGVLDVSSDAGNVTVHNFSTFGASSIVYYKYNVFYCTE